MCNKKDRESIVALRISWRVQVGNFSVHLLIFYVILKQVLRRTMLIRLISTIYIKDLARAPKMLRCLFLFIYFFNCCQDFI